MARIQLRDPSLLVSPLRGTKAGSQSVILDISLSADVTRGSEETYRPACGRGLCGGAAYFIIKNVHNCDRELLSQANFAYLPDYHDSRHLCFISNYLIVLGL